MDAIDSRIIDILRANARESFSSIGREVGLSTNAVITRVRRLEAAGVILGYRAEIAEDSAPGGSALEAFIDIRLRSDRDSDEFLSWTTQVAEVSDAVHVTGPYDYLLIVRVRGMRDLDGLLRRLKAEAGVAQTQTRVALRS